VGGYACTGLALFLRSVLVCSYGFLAVPLALLGAVCGIGALARGDRRNGTIVTMASVAAFVLLLALLLFGPPM
jgi:hypothetical protein